MFGALLADQAAFLPGMHRSLLLAAARLAPRDGRSERRSNGRHTANATG